MRRLSVCTALAVCLAMPASAPAATTFVVKGAGFGHGVGMSQYGAQGFAQHGWDYARILGHYYRGTTIGSAPTETIRVLLRSGGTSTVSHVSRAGKRKLNASRTYTARTSGSRVVLRGGGRSIRLTAPTRLRGPGGYTVLNGSAYRGAMELRPGLTAINVALATDAGAALFDQYADTRSQVYKGMSAEQPSTNAAAHDTAGQVVLYEGAIATTFYFSTSGGRTENVENSFLGAAPSPYLKSVEDPYDDISPRHRWQLRFTRARLGSALGGLCRGRFQAIKVVKHGVSPRVVAADVVCTRGRVRTSGPALRARLGLYDSWFRVVRASSKKAKQAADLNVPAVGRLLHPTTITGSFSSRPSVVSVERRDESTGAWQLVARGLTNAAGAYRVPVYGSGTYRVGAGGVFAPNVTVR
jgi:stage II sporulation protein D